MIRAADGSSAIFIDLERLATSELRQLIAQARSMGVDQIWANGFAADRSLGFERAGGHARLEAASLRMPIALPSPPLELTRNLRNLCFEGICGHLQSSTVHADSTFVGLHEGEGWIGICEVDIARRRIIDPGVRRGRRTPDRYARLVRGAADRLGPGPVTLETRGDSDDTLAAYKQLGLELVAYIPTWRLNLKRRRGPLLR